MQILWSIELNEKGKLNISLQFFGRHDTNPEAREDAIIIGHHAFKGQESYETMLRHLIYIREKHTEAWKRLSMVGTEDTAVNL